MDIILTVDCAEEDVACHVGLVTQYIPQIKLDNVQNTVAVVVGPPAMMRFSVQGLLDIGLQKKMSGFLRNGKCAAVWASAVTVRLGTPMFAWTVQYLTIPKGNF